MATEEYFKYSTLHFAVLFKKRQSQTVEQEHFAQGENGRLTAKTELLLHTANRVRFPALLPTCDSLPGHSYIRDLVHWSAHLPD
ncbi:MAG: hypothetical protein IJZ19_00655 [Lentisphaeria bacterium]|nr:hypothetical protein [Lentisphaeria bacterium]